MLYFQVKLTINYHITLGEDGIPLSTVVRIVKLAYCYEMWDTFDSMMDNTIAAIKVLRYRLINYFLLSVEPELFQPHTRESFKCL